ncbi:hypothetical protein LOZ39_005590 [Ophidiomyces ophidiicola]|nr:hypothetical protein LOZ49_004196 [Ophidiomyces ophidiicola]KAI2068884.1 hypothetical protein LOZ39_005590 [Ophidiomyces ophidiicola]KAI2139110.1 hypothetical protein LOZ29_002541 [Ophidiomyces ophidiicola]KAI2140061.1 hypothetical protein LOZ28_003000 [Ophidiomyces ophidiicola]KAI2220161.1 hypothetical protein LOZ15_002375 [Ophidiomyces ophidiicola]
MRLFHSLFLLGASSALQTPTQTYIPSKNSRTLDQFHSGYSVGISPSLLAAAPTDTAPSANGFPKKEDILTASDSNDVGIYCNHSKCYTSTILITRTYTVPVSHTTISTTRQTTTLATKSTTKSSIQWPTWWPSDIPTKEPPCSGDWCWWKTTVTKTVRESATPITVTVGITTTVTVPLTITYTEKETITKKDTTTVEETEYKTLTLTLSKTEYSTTTNSYTITDQKTVTDRRTVTDKHTVTDVVTTEQTLTLPPSTTTDVITLPAKTITNVITLPRSTSTVVKTLPAITVTLPGTTITLPPTTKTIVVTLPPSIITQTSTLPGMVTTVYRPATDQIITKTSNYISLCPSRTLNPTFTPTAPLPTDYIWGCPPGSLCKPMRSAMDGTCNFDVGPPSANFFCSPEECPASPSLHPPQYWGTPVVGSTVKKFIVSLGYYNLDPRKFGLGFDIFLFENATQSSEVGKRQVIKALPAVCYDECNNSVLEAQSKGDPEKLCRKGSAFLTHLDECNRCIRAHRQPNHGTFDDILRPDFESFLNLCKTLPGNSTVVPEPQLSHSTNPISQPTSEIESSSLLVSSPSSAPFASNSLNSSFPIPNSNIQTYQSLLFTRTPPSPPIRSTNSQPETSDTANSIRTEPPRTSSTTAAEFTGVAPIFKPLKYLHIFTNTLVVAFMLKFL